MKSLTKKKLATVIVGLFSLEKRRLKIAKGLQSVKVFSSTAPKKSFEKSHNVEKKLKGGPFGLVRYCVTRETFLVQFPGPTGAI